MRDTHLTVAKALRVRLQHAAITPGQWYFLRALWAEEGLSQRELSRRVGTSEPATFNALRQLEKNGFIARARHSGDKRTNSISLTAAGRRLEAELIHHAIEVNRAAVSGFSGEEIALLHELLGRIKLNLTNDLLQVENTP